MLMKSIKFIHAGSPSSIASLSHLGLGRRGAGFDAEGGEETREFGPHASNPGVPGGKMSTVNGPQKVQPVDPFPVMTCKT